MDFSLTDEQTAIADLAHRILSELVEEGYVLRERQGRRNRYQVKPELPLRHPLVQEREVGELLKVLSEG